jgi:hypothetical protein
MPITLNGSAGVTTNSGAIYDGIQRGTTVASTSGTSIDFTGIPSWVKRITVMFSGVSTNGSSIVVVRLGTSSGIESTSYVSGGAYSPTGSNVYVTSNTGFNLPQAAASAISAGLMTICSVGSNLWVSNYSGVNSGESGASTAGGSKTLSGTLDRIRITTVNGTDTFDAGSINILYE